MTVFRPARSDRIVALLIGLPAGLLFIVVGVFGATMTPNRFAVILFGLLGALCVVYTLGYSLMVTKVCDQGVAVRPLIYMMYSFSWEDVESWLLIEENFDGNRCVRFQFHGTPSYREIEESEVALPGFDEFVSLVRLHAGVENAE